MIRHPLRSFTSPLLTLFTTSLILTTSAGAIELHPGLPEDQRRSIEYDLATLDRLVPKDDASTSVAASKMGIRGKFDATALHQWLGARAHYIVPQNWDSQNAISVENRSVRYPNPGILPFLEMPKKDAANGNIEEQKGTVMTVMANLGSSLYFIAKKMGKALSVKIDPKHTETVLSPRLGLIQVGQGLFNKGFRADSNTADTPANSLARLMTLFHESRHSDGNGASLSYFHAICPEGHPYAGYSACDRSRNGPYTVGANILKVMLNQCDQCSVAGKEFLRAMALDSFSRVLLTKTQTRTTKPDATSLFVLRAKKMLCNAELRMRLPEYPRCTEYRKELSAALSAPIVPTVDLDARPEIATE